MPPASVQVHGAKELQRVFEQLTPALTKKYLRQAVTKTTAQVRTTARRQAPDGRRTGTTALKSASARTSHEPLRKNIRSLKTRVVRNSGTVHNRVVGPPQQGPLVSGHSLVAWGRATDKRVEPSTDYMGQARDQNEGYFEREGAEMVKEFIRRDVKRLGKKQAAATLSKAGMKRLAVLRGTGLA